MKAQGRSGKGFIEVPRSVLASISPHSYEIIISGEIRIRVGDGFNPLTLANLIRTIQGL